MSTVMVTGLLLELILKGPCGRSPSIGPAEEGAADTDGDGDGGPADQAGSRRAQDLRTDDERQDQGGGAEADGDEPVHIGQPPRADDGPLSSRFDAIADRVERRFGQFARAVPEEGVELAVEVAARGHAIRS